MDYDFEKILAEYRSKKTPDGRRDCIARWAALTGRQKSEIAAALLAAGQQVDGRLLPKNWKKPTVVVATSVPEMPGWDPVQEVLAEEAPPEPEPEPAGMTVATLRQMLDGVAGEALILVGDDLVPCVRAEFQAVLDAQGERTYCHLALMGF